MSSDRRQQIGPWHVGEQLGAGGNATVWAASRMDGEPPAALKVIKVNKVEREPYQRFVREITFLRDHDDVAGILPLIDAHLPEQPTRNDQPWLAMPIATPMSAALAQASLPDVVAAVATVADT